MRTEGSRVELCARSGGNTMAAQEFSYYLQHFLTNKNLTVKEILYVCKNSRPEHSTIIYAGLIRQSYLHIIGLLLGVTTT